MTFKAKFLSGLLLFLPLSVHAAEYPITGTLLPYATTKIAPQVSGRVLEILKDIGQVVQKGDVLLKLDPAFLEIEYKKKNAQVKLSLLHHEKMEREYLRRKILWENQPPSISKLDLEESEFLMQQALLNLEQSRLELEVAKLQLDETCIKSPYDGFITKRFIDIGDSVQVMANLPLVEVMDLAKLWLEFSLPQDLQDQVTIGQKVIMCDQIVGTIEKIVPSVDVSNRCFLCRVLVDNETQALKPGMFLTGKLILNE